MLAAVNISPKEMEIVELVRGLRRDTRNVFARRLQRAVQEGEVPVDFDVQTTADALNMLLEGMLIQVRDGMSRETLRRTGQLAGLLIGYPKKEERCSAPNDSLS